ncbi:MAG: hypothetical protein LBL52_01070 [Rickettsiales bacterium]|jgi:hypothetical protein|nr:hypothetical protein [Rickettsiales bacterium]
MSKKFSYGVSMLALLAAFGADTLAQRRNTGSAGGGSSRGSRDEAVAGANSSRRGSRGNNAGITADQGDSTRRPTQGGSSSTSTVVLPNIKYFKSSSVSLAYGDLVLLESLLENIMTPEGYAQYLEHPYMITLKTGNNSTGGYASNGQCSKWGWMKGDQLITVDAYNILPSMEKLSYAPAIITGAQTETTNCTDGTAINDCDANGDNPGQGTNACNSSNIHYGTPYAYKANEYLVIWDNLVVGGTPSYNINYNNAHAIAYLKLTLNVPGSNDITYSSSISDVGYRAKYDALLTDYRNYKYNVEPRIRGLYEGVKQGTAKCTNNVDVTFDAGTAPVCAAGHTVKEVISGGVYNYGNSADDYVVSLGLGGFINRKEEKYSLNAACAGIEASDLDRIGNYMVATQFTQGVGALGGIVSAIGGYAGKEGECEKFVKDANGNDTTNCEKIKKNTGGVVGTAGLVSAAAGATGVIWNAVESDNFTDQINKAKACREITKDLYEWIKTSGFKDLNVLKP